MAAPGSARINYLAHALLAEPHAYSVIGNVAGDLVKGRIEDHRLHPRVADGVRRHRRVDALTDAHPRYRALVSAFPVRYRRVAPIVLDVLFDHYLSRLWTRVTAIDRDDFIDGVYAVLTQHGAPLPETLAERAPVWVAADWLRAYGSLEGVEAVLGRLGARARRPLPLLAAYEAACALEDELQAGFIEVFGDVRAALQ
ncbi:MAG: ACP phosphodiesterase [Halieaceae bacterium]|nr:ACP phosphodiesterase [Halieaceae bacterium]